MATMARHYWQVRGMLAGVMVIWSLPAQSLETLQDPYQEHYNACVNAAGGINNAVVMRCGSAASDLAQSDMTQMVKMIEQQIAQSSPEKARTFSLGQAAWVKYRDNHCQLMTDYVGSPMEAYCPMSLNGIRVQELKVLAQSMGLLK
ncbi:lysozyme inhibitor LprI family protein [Motilimonas pumila]|uniref:DUF1311 domain-containing protein n=1 Tax=Motilimonas pumila TaxID=2303987 RepID=A0A418YAF1_9GAMM|nr:lysozyme inhibitor LprI family protein [Motilimonas pumila]RJG39527.1 DUF1311 domain-containing protein [Motilimonas pumila]